MADSNKDKRRENIFEIIDNVMFHLNTTKKMFLIMIISTLILPPIVVIGVVSVTDPAEHPKAIFHNQLLEQLKSGEITQEEFIEQMENQMKHKKFKGPGFGGLQKNPLHLVLLIVAVFWLGFGIRQWYVLSSWGKKSENYKKRQEELDKKLDDESDDKEEN